MKSVCRRAAAVAFLCTVAYLLASGGGSSHDGVRRDASSAPSQHHTSSDTSATPLDEAPLTGGSLVDVSLSCFYRTPNFYNNRATPSMAWAVVFVASLWKSVRHRGEGAVHMVMFVDAQTHVQLVQDLIQAGYESVLASHFIEFVVVAPPADIGSGLGSKGDSKGRAPEVPPIDASRHQWRIIRPKFFDEPWVAGIPNGANNFRFALFRDWLQQHESRTRLVMLSDVTDVAFQSDPFASPACACRTPWCAEGKSFVTFTLESAKKVFANEKYNKRWLKCYGEDVYQHMKWRRISCAGVTLGNARGVLLYTTLQLEQIQNPALVSCAMNVIHAALDQATHNYVLFTAYRNANASSAQAVPGPNDGILSVLRTVGAEGAVESEEVQFVMAGNDCVFHGNYGEFALRGNLVFSPAAFFTNGVDRSVPYPIVHQYTSDRHPAIMKAMEREHLGNKGRGDRAARKSS